MRRGRVRGEDEYEARTSTRRGRVGGEDEYKARTSMRRGRVQGEDEAERVRQRSDLVMRLQGGEVVTG